MQAASVYKMKFLIENTEHQLKACQKVTENLHERYSRIFHSVQLAHLKKLELATERQRTEQNDQIAAMNQLNEKVVSELEGSIEQVREQLKKEKDEAVHREKEILDQEKEFHREILGLQEKITDLKGQSEEKERQLQQKELTLHDLKAEMTRTKRKDDQELSVRQDIWSKKLDMWQMSQEQEQAKWAEEKVDLQLTIAKLESKVRILNAETKVLQEKIPSFTALTSQMSAQPKVRLFDSNVAV